MDSIEIKVGGATVVFSLAALFSVVKQFMEMSPAWTHAFYIFVGVCAIAAVNLILWAYFQKGQKRKQEREELNATLRRIQEDILSRGGMIRAFTDDRVEWYRALTYAIRTAPRRATVHDTTCGLPRPDKATVDVLAARADYRTAISSRNDLVYYEIYGSNFEPDVRELLKANPNANVRVIPCVFPQFLFTDFLVIRLPSDGGLSEANHPGDVFLSGLNFPGGELDLWIRDPNVTEFFHRYFHSLNDAARKVTWDTDHVKILKTQDGGGVSSMVLNADAKCTD